MTEKVSFCDNPLCQFHKVEVGPAAEYIQRELPPKPPAADGMIERHIRIPYRIDKDTLYHFCEVCAAAIERCRPAEKPKEKKIIGSEKNLVMLS